MLPVRKSQEKLIYRPPSPPRWKGRDSLDLVHQLNERCLKLLSDVAKSPDACEWPPIAHQRELWSTLDGDVVERAARFPFVILDVHFTNEKWWRWVSEPRDASAEDRAPSSQRWPARVAGELMQETLIFAWHTAKWDRRVARLSLGMSPTVAESIAGLTPRQLATISSHHSAALRLRWQDNADFWGRLLVVARSDDQEALIEIHLHAKLLLCGELISRSTLTRIPA
jgi:hypothetical protein